MSTITAYSFHSVYILILSLVPRPSLLPSPDGLAREVEFLGFMGGATNTLIEYLKCEMIVPKLTEVHVKQRALFELPCVIVRVESNSKLQSHKIVQYKYKNILG